MREAGQTLEVREESPEHRTWSITIYDELLRFIANEGSSSFDVEQNEAAEQITVYRPIWGKPLLVVSDSPKKFFRLEADEFALLKAWLGPPTITTLKTTLRQQLGWGLAVGIFLIISSLPSPADPEAQLEALTFDPLSAVMGAALVFLRVLVKFCPCRELFLADSAWFTILGGKVAYDVLFGANWIWLAVTLLSLLAAIAGLRKYHRFANLASSECEQMQQLSRINTN